ncbi:MAG: phage tail tube protein [Actinomycetota bacterium]
MESQSWRPNDRLLRSAHWRAGRKKVTGSVVLELQNKTMGVLFLHMLGARTITTPAGGILSRDHTCTLGTLIGDSLTMQAGRDDRGGTVRAFSYLGCKIARWKLSCSVGEIGMLSLDVLGQDESTAQALATASYASALELFSFVQGTLTIAAVSTPVRQASIAGDNALPDDDYALGSALMRQPIEPIVRTITGRLDADFTDLTAYNRFVNGTEAALVLQFVGSIIEGALSFQITVTANVRFDGETPTVAGPEEIRQSLPFKVVKPAAGTDFEIVYRTTDTA